MPSLQPWTAWGVWDVPTVVWVGWVVQFLALESWAVVTGQPVHTFTWHLRPFFLAHPLAYFLGVGFYVWLGLHFFAPAVEQAMLDLLAGRG